ATDETAGRFDLPPLETADALPAVEAQEVVELDEAEVEPLPGGAPLFDAEPLDDLPMFDGPAVSLDGAVVPAAAADAGSFPSAWSRPAGAAAPPSPAAPGAAAPPPPGAPAAAAPRGGPAAAPIAAAPGIAPSAPAPGAAPAMPPPATAAPAPRAAA